MLFNRIILSKVMGSNFKYLITIFSITILYGVYYWGIPAVINLPDRVDYIEASVLKQSGYKIDIVNPDLKMGLIPSVWLKADRLDILNNDNSKALSIEKPCINIRLLPLILKDVNIKHFSASNISANFVFDKDKKFKLGQYPIEIQQNQPFKLKYASVNLDSYHINLYDKIQNKKMSLDGKYLSINDFIYNKLLNLSTIAELKAGNEKSFIKTDLNLKLPINKISDNQLDISGHIVNLNLADFSVYVKTLTKNKIKSLSGIINMTAKTDTMPDNHKKIKTNLYINNLGILTGDISTAVFYKDKLYIKTDINTINNGIEINEMKISGNGINALVFGKIKKLNEKLPKLDLKVSVNNTKADKVIELLPGDPNLSPDIDLQLLKKTGFWGDAAGNLEIKGKADFPNIYGNILISNAYMVKPIKNAKKATIKIAFTGDKLNLDVKVPTSPTQTVYVTGPINLYNDKYAELNIKSTNDVDLKTAQIVLNPLHDILHFELGPVPIMDIKGKGGIDLHIIGTKQNPHGWGQFRFKDATVSFLDIHNMVMTNGSGTLDFDNQNTLFQTKTAKLNGKNISVKGTCSLTGDLNFNVATNGQDLGNLLKIIKTSPMLTDIQKLVETIENGNGPANLNLNLTGKVKDPKDIVFNKNLFAKGSINLLSDTIKLKGLPASISKISGIINFNNMDADFDLLSHLNKSQIKINGKIKENNLNAQIVSNKFNLGDGLATLPANMKLPYKNDISTINTSFTGKYNGSIENIDYNNIYLKGKIYSNKGAKSQIIVDNSSFELNNSTFKLPLLRGTFKNSPYYISLHVAKMFDKKRVVNGNCKISSLDLNLINDNALQYILPPDISKQFRSIDFLNGKVNLSAKIKNNNINAYTKLDNLNLLYKPKHLKISLKSGDILLRNNILNLNKINTLIGDMPVYISGQISEVQSKNPYLTLYLNAKPSQEFFDQFFNNDSIYPIKLKGDAIFSSNIRGNLDKLNTKSLLKISENSSLYYMGASIGDAENPVRINIDSTYYPDKIKINNLRYDKIITSQNNKPYIKPQLTSQGTLGLINNSIVKFSDFKVKTHTPTDAKIFNIIFRKPFMKQGVFTSDLILNGTSINPKIQGKLDITSIDIPFVDSTIRDVNLDFKHDKIFINSRGTVLTNDINLDAIMKNQLVPPYTIENVKLKLADLNLNKITDTLRDIEAEAIRNQTYSATNIAPFDLTQLIINNANIEADKIKVRNINADNFNAHLTLNKEGTINVNNFKFNIAQGSVKGNFKHNLKNHKTNIDIHLDRANALIMSEALFDLKGQVYGSVNGAFNLYCTGDSQENCFNTLSGEGTFKIADGRMPKLGSLEYLLKAGNLLKGGFTGLSINSIIDLITPLKTGNFDSISGDIHLTEGTADRINIYSDGQDLNMYMTGSYNLLTSIADMEIYGSLSKNITTVFGKIKNASLNTLLNTIPGINDATEKLLLQKDISKIPNIKNATDIYRIFKVDINGDINGSDYVRSFKWVK